ncbi:organic cation transporter protein-like isoform X2 [Galleria mellonella]|uniref:Organic cation transporter protein-like isoform X2 n=1 Tax=Galleria mellonella TaxID=7137 RepID=A0ABM3MF07_GALME|nr:organic cation transporter protein-like isoform X2 [Galleria mellonella]
MSSVKKERPSTNSDNGNSGVDLDLILVEEIGQLGRYQLITLALASLPAIFGAFTSEYIFTVARIPTRCRIPQCDPDILHPEFRPEWILNAVPGISVDSFEECVRYVNRNYQAPSNQTCPAWWFDNSTMDCEELIYGNTHSVVFDFKLGCDEWRRSLIGTVRTVGTLIVLPITGYISDRWGRRMALTLNAFNTGWTGLVRSFVHTYEWFLALEVIEACLGAGGFSSCYILVTELVGPKYRVMAGATISTMFAIGQVMLGFIAWNVPSWRLLTQVLYVPQLIVISYFWILPESVRWLMSKDRYEESEAILKKVAKTNKKELSEKSLALLRTRAEVENKTIIAEDPWLPVLVFRSRVILQRCIISPIWWITMTLVYYGMTINAVHLSGNQYLNFVIVSAIEIPGYWTAILLLDRIGRKPVLICAFWICAVCQFTFGFMSEGMDTLSLIVYLIGKYSISVAVTSLYVYTAELFPTKYRHSLFAFASMIGRLGSITAPLTPALAQEVWEPFPSVLFGSFALLSGLLIFTTPETLGTKLPDTIEDAELVASRKIDV